MSMEAKTSLREWAKENEIWEPKTWRIFLEKDLVPFYKQAYTLNKLYIFLTTYVDKHFLADIKDETLKNKIRVAIYGGVKPNKKDFNTSFAKFMYDNFGIHAEDASSFEESIEYYEKFGDGIKVSIKNSWISSILFKSLVDKTESLVDKLEDLIRNFCKELGIKFSEIGLQGDYFLTPLEVIKPDTLLPQPGEKPEELIELINNFRQKALDLSIGVNPFTTFVFYSRAIPLLTLMEFLECDIDKVTKLANFLGLKAYSMIDESEVSLPTESPEKVMLLPPGGKWSRSGTTYYPTLIEKTLELQNYLERVDPIIKQIYEDMIKQAVDQIQVTFEPWRDYEPLLSAILDIMKDEYGCELIVSQGRINKIRNRYSRHYRKYREIELPNRIWLKDFLIKISPAVSAGIIKFSLLNSSYRFSYSMTQLEPHSLTREWIEKVIENEGKT